MRMPSISLRRATKVGAGLATVLLASSIAWAWFRGKPMPQALWSSRVLESECHSEGDVRACVRACDRGVPAGCLITGSILRETDAGGAAGPATYFERACRSGNTEGCKRWQETAPALAEHASSKDYLAWLAPTGFACDQGDSPSCWKIAAAALGVDTPRARTALARYCASSKDGSSDTCLREGEQRIVNVAERAPSCDRGDLVACRDLAVLALQGHGGVLAGEAAANLCGLTGFDGLLGYPPMPPTEECLPREKFPFPAGARGYCAQHLVDDLGFDRPPYHRGNMPARDAGNPDAAGRSGAILPKAGLATITPAAIDDALRPLIAEQLPSFARCLARGVTKEDAIANRATSMAVDLILDRLGDPWFVRGDFSHDDQRFVDESGADECIESYFRTLHLRPPPSDAVKVHVKLLFTKG
jgi:hypothetical protein